MNGFEVLVVYGEIWPAGTSIQHDDERKFHSRMKPFSVIMNVNSDWDVPIVPSYAGHQAQSRHAECRDNRSIKVTIDSEFAHIQVYSDSHDSCLHTQYTKYHLIAEQCYMICMTETVQEETKKL